jgi:hypothetical protein
MHKLASLALAAGVALSQAGCYAVGYAYPTLDHVPETRASALPEQVYAIRVDHRLATTHGMNGPGTHSECLFRPPGRGHQTDQ